MRISTVSLDEMTTSLKNIGPTAFPRLDTLSANRGPRRQHPIYRRREQSYANNLKEQPRGKTGLLQGFSRFIAALTGEEEVCFKFIIRNDYVVSSAPEIVAAEVSRDSIEIDQQQQTLDNVEHFDFGLELLADLDNFDYNESLQLDCVSFQSTELFR